MMWVNEITRAAAGASRRGGRAQAVLWMICCGLGLAGCESTGNTVASAGPAPLVAEVAPQTNAVAQGDIGTWDGRGASKVEFGRVVQSRPVVIDGRSTVVGTLGGGATGAVVTAPKTATTGAMVVNAAGTIGGTIVGRKVEEVLTRQDGQEIMIRLEEGKVVTVTQGVEDGYFQEGDLVKVVHGERGAFVSLTNVDERAVIKREELRVRREGAWYERTSAGN